MSLLVQNDSGGTVVPFVTGCHPSGPMLVVVVKRVFHLVQGKPLTPVEPAPPPGGCRFAGDDPLGECVADSELAPFKPQADVLLSGSCHTPGGRPLPALVAGFSVGSLVRRIAVFGERTWKRGLFSAGASDPKPFTVMPLSWSRAYGAVGWADNPVGCGRDSDHLPNLELPERLLAKAKSAQPPAGVGPLNPLWPARAKRLGTFPSDWLKHHAPAYPADFDWTYFNAAPVEQRLAALRGDETCSFTHLHPEAPDWSVKLPSLGMRLAVEDDDGKLRRRTVALTLDTLHADTDAGTLTLLWRTWLPVRGRTLAGISRLVVVAESLAAPLPAEDLLRRLAKLEPEPVPTPPAPPAPVPPPIDWRARLAPSADLRGANLAGFDLTSCDLRGADLSGADLSGASLPHANLTGARLIGTRFEAARLTGANLERAVADGASFDHAQAAGLRGTGARFVGASFVGTHLDDADLSGADLSRASLIGASAKRIIASRALLVNTRVAEGTDLTEARLDHVQGATSCWQQARLVQADLRESDFPGAVFPQAVLTHARLTACDLTRAVFTGADLQRADLSGSQCLHASFHQADCRHAVFTGACCFETDFTLCAVAGGVFQGTDLTRTVLK